MMGNPLYSDDIGAMCFNAANNWQLGWYDSNAICIETGTGNDRFIACNRATGVNRQNHQADNQVTIIQSGSNGEWYSQSFLLKTLSAGQEHAIPNWNNGQTLHINISLGNEAPGYAVIVVCLGECNVSSETTKAPSSLSARPSLKHFFNKIFIEIFIEIISYAMCFIEVIFTRNNNIDVMMRFYSF